MELDLAIRHGALVSPAGVLHADIGILGTRIVTVSTDLDLQAQRTVDASGCLVLPGAVDPHVHLQMPLNDVISADDFTSGTRAAALGGTTTVIDFVEPQPGETFEAALGRRRAEADGRVAIDYGLHMTAPAWHASLEDAALGQEIAAAIDAGCPSFKLYMAYARLGLTDDQLFRALQQIGRRRALAMVHCENGAVCETLRAQAVERGALAPIHHAETRPPRQEAEATGRIADLAALAGCNLYVAHVSCQESWARIAGARRAGQMVWAETCPHYLLLDRAELCGEHGERLICAPPLRAEEDRTALWTALIEGSLDVVSTDHCPFTAADKANHEAFTTVPGGLPSIEARLSLVHHYGQAKGLSPARWVEVCCWAPARIFGLPSKGSLAPGYDADVVVFDPGRRLTIHAGSTLHEHVDWSPYEGWAIKGWPRDVFCRGRQIVRDSAFVGEPGWGRFVQRTLPPDPAS